MDISKLPRMSKTEGQAPSSEMPPAQQPAPQPVRPVDYGPPGLMGGQGPAAWISIGVGLIFVFAFPHFTQWWIHVLFHTNPPSFLPITDSQTGAEIPYPKSVFFLSDLAIAMFAYALVLDGIVLLIRRRAVLMLALVVTAAAVALNVYYLIKSFADDSGFPIVSAVAVLFGGYMLWYQWMIFAKKSR
jgi:hypothetical protein